MRISNIKNVFWSKIPKNLVGLYENGIWFQQNMSCMFGWRWQNDAFIQSECIKKNYGLCFSTGIMIEYI